MRIALELKLKPIVMAKAKENMKAGGGKNPQPLTDLSKAASDKKHNTRKAVAKSSGYSEGTVQNVETALDSAIDEVKSDMLAGKVKPARINRRDDFRFRIRQNSRCVVHRLSADADRSASGGAGS